MPVTPRVQRVNLELKGAKSEREFNPLRVHEIQWEYKKRVRGQESKSQNFHFFLIKILALIQAL